MTDSGGVALSNVAVTFTAPASGASATLSSARVSTNAAGEAALTAAANSFPGSYQVTASAGGAAPAIFSLTNVQAPSLRANPATLSLQVIAGGSSTASAPLQVTSAGGALFFETGSSAAWLTIIPSQAQTTAILTVTANAAGLRPGTYQASIILRPTGGTATTVPVQFTVIPPCPCSPLPLR